MRIFTIIIFVISFLFTGTGFAKQSGAYIGGSFGGTTFEDDNRFSDIGLNIDDKDRGGQLFGGFNFNRYIGVEGTLASLGEYSDTTGLYKDSFGAFTVTAVGKLPVGRGPVSFYGKAGLGIISWEEDTFFGLTQSDTGGTVTIGLGVMFTPGTESYLTFRLGWDFYTFAMEETTPPFRDYNQTLGLGSLGLQFNF